MANMPACSICSIPLVLALRQKSNALGPTAWPATQLLTSALSTSTFTKKRLLYSFDRASNTGAIALHGPHLYRPISCRRDTLQSRRCTSAASGQDVSTHHVAQQSTMTCNAKGAL